MKKTFKIWLFILACFLVIRVSAAERYYYIATAYSDGIITYSLCDRVNNNCVVNTKADLERDNAIITNNSVQYKGITYVLDDGLVTSAGEPNPSNVTPGDSVDNDTTTTTPKKEKEVKAPSTDTCDRLKEPLKFIGHIVTIFKILIPVVLIILGALDFFHAVTADKDDAIKKSVKTFALRILAGVVIFFLPTIVSFIFSLLDSWGEFEGDFDACQKCVFRVSKCE